MANEQTDSLDQGRASFAWQRLSDPQALSWRVGALYLPIGLAGPLLIDPQRLGGSPWTWLVVGLAGQLGLMITLLVFRQVARRYASALLTVIAIGVAALVRGLTLASVASVLGLAPTWELSYRVIAALGPQTGILLVLALMVGNQAHIRNITIRLIAHQATLAQASQRSEETLRQRYADIGTLVRSLVAPLVEQLDAAGARANADRAQVHESIRRIVDDELRPLSHRLTSAEYEIPDFTPSVNDVPTTSSALPTRAPLTLLLRPFGAAVLALLLSGSQALRGLPVLDTIAFPTLFGLLVGVILWIVAHLLPWRPPIWWGLLLAAALTGVSFVAAINLVMLLGVAMPQMLNGPALVTGLYVGALLGTNAALGEQQRQLQAGLRRVVDELEIYMSLLRQQDFLARKQLSYVIHGSVQSSLHAAALKIGRADQPTPELLAGIRADINEALARLESNAPAYVLLVQALDDIAELWDGTATVRWTLDHRTVRQLVQSPSTAHAVAEIVTESVGNAIRHGHATEVGVSIEAERDRIILRVIDNGIGMPADPVPGLGSRMFDELCLHWDRTSDDLGTVLTAEVAVAAQLQEAG